MRSTVIAASLALVLCAAPALAQQVEPEIFTLPNGMKFLLVPRSDQPNAIAAGWLAKVGSVNERPGITGISHFFEHMMFKGTDTIGTRDPKRDADYRRRQKELRDKINATTWTEQYARFFRGEIDDPWSPANDTPALAAMRAELKALMDEQQGKAGDDEIKKVQAEVAKVDTSLPGGEQRKKDLEAQLARLKEQQGALSTIVKDEFDKVYTAAGGTGMNAFTSNDLTFFFINVPSNKLELWAWMESDRLNGSVFREFYSERDVVHEERRLRTESTPTGVFQEQFDSMFWMSSPYGWPVIGWTSDLNSYTMEEAQKYWNTYYRPNNLVGIIVGDFNPAEAKATITRYFSRLEPGKTAPPPVVTLEQKQMAEQRMYAEAETQPQVEIRYHTVPAMHKDSYALDMMASLLNGRTGRLYKSMVEGSGIASSASAQQESRKYAGLFAFSADTKGDATPQQLEEAWYAELKKLQTEPVPEKELQKVKNQSAADSYRRLQNNFFLMIQLAYAEALGDWSEINAQNAKLQAVTAEDIQRVANKYFGKDNRSVAVFTRKATAAPAADPELAEVPGPMQAMARQAAARIAKETDAAKLKEALEGMDAQAAQMPPQMKPAMDYMRKKIEARLAELEKTKK
ncbi:MAG: insulinase family protein [Phycisphaerales bacterium]